MTSLSAGKPALQPVLPTGEPAADPPAGQSGGRRGGDFGNPESGRRCGRAGPRARGGACSPSPTPPCGLAPRYKYCGGLGRGSRWSRSAATEARGFLRALGIPGSSPAFVLWDQGGGRVGQDPADPRLELGVQSFSNPPSVFCNWMILSILHFFFPGQFLSGRY